jgi:hypothetical protein
MPRGESDLEGALVRTDTLITFPPKAVEELLASVRRLKQEALIKIKD